MLDRKMSLKYIKFFALFILALGAISPAFADCTGYEWTYDWKYPYNNLKAVGCGCNESGNGVVISQKGIGTRNYWDGGIKSWDDMQLWGLTSEKRQCKFPTASLCTRQSLFKGKWQQCAGSWINPESPSTSVTSLTDGMTAEMTDNGWLWKCKAGYSVKSDKSGCVINSTSSGGTSDGKVLYKGQLYDKPAPGYGFDYTPGTASDAIIECSTKTLANGLVYQKLFDGHVCITCTGNFYIRNTEMWFENGNCGEVKKIGQYKFTDCAKKGLIDKYFENCLLN